MDFSLIPTATLFVAMLALGMELTLRDFIRVLQFPKAFLLGMTGQMLLLPVIALLLVSLVPVNSSVAIGLILLAACPGGATSNLFSRYAGGDTALSISLTGASSLLAPLSVPLIVTTGVLMVSGDAVRFHVSALEMVTMLALTTALPVVLGMVWAGVAPQLAARCRPVLMAMATIVLVCLIIGLGVNTARIHVDVMGMVSRSLPAVVLLVLGTALAGALLGRLGQLNIGQKRSLVIEVGIQNINLAMVVALQYLESPAYLGPTLVYLPVMLVFAAIVISAARWRSLITGLSASS